MSADLRSLAPGLVRDASGLWVSADEASVSYPQDGHEQCFSLEDDSFWFQHRSAVITSVVESFPPAGDIFDIGGGNGFVARSLENKGLPCILIEPGRVGATNAVKRGVETVVCATLESAGFREGSMTAAGLFDVIEHIEDEQGFLARLHRLLAPDGRVYLTVPAVETLWSNDDVHAGHFRRYSKTSLRRSLERAGFVVEFVSYFFWFLVAPIFALRTVPSRLGFQKTASGERGEKEHRASAGVTKRIMDEALRFEADRIRRLAGMPFGSSCVAVARRVNRT